MTIGGSVAISGNTSVPGSLTVQAVATGVDPNSLSYSWVATNEESGAQYTGSGLSWTFMPADGGTYNVALSAFSDSAEFDATTTFTVQDAPISVELESGRHQLRRLDRRYRRGHRARDSAAYSRPVSPMRGP